MLGEGFGTLTSPESGPAPRAPPQIGTVGLRGLIGGGTERPRIMFPGLEFPTSGAQSPDPAQDSQASVKKAARGNASGLFTEHDAA